MILKKQRRAQRSAFTLMEVLVVAAILVVLAGSGAMIYMRFLDDSKVSRAKMDVISLTKAVEAYEIHNSTRPPTLDVLAGQQADGGKAYIERDLLRDPWGQSYQYSQQGQHNALSGKPDIWSAGPPGASTAPIGNWSTSQ